MYVIMLVYRYQLIIIAILILQLYTSFEKQHKKMKSLIEKKGRLRESDVIEIIETVCENSFDE